MHAVRENQIGHKSQLQHYRLSITLAKQLIYEHVEIELPALTKGSICGGWNICHHPATPLKREE